MLDPVSRRWYVFFRDVENLRDRGACERQLRISDGIDEIIRFAGL